MATATGYPAETLVGSAEGYLLASGKIRFQGSRTDILSSPYSDYIVIHKNTPVDLVIKYMKTEWELYDPDVLFSVTGGADLKGMLPRHEPTFKEGFAAAAGSVASWVVSGGTDRGVMRMVGDAVAQNSVEVPCIKIATLGKMVGWKELIQKKGWTNDSDTYEYDMTRMMERADESRASDGGETDSEGKEGTTTLNPGHSHFILVHSMDAGCANTKIMKFDVQWGDENEFREVFEEALPQREKVKQANSLHLGAVPVQLVVNGGPETMKTVSSAVHANIPVVSFRGTGRAANLLCVLQRHSQHLETARSMARDDEGGRPPSQMGFPNSQDSRLDRIRQEILDLGGGGAESEESAAGAMGSGWGEGAAGIPDSSTSGGGGGSVAGSESGDAGAGGIGKGWGRLQLGGQGAALESLAAAGSPPMPNLALHGTVPPPPPPRWLTDNSIIDARVFHPMALADDWGTTEARRVWIPPPLFKWMAGLARPPSPKEYFAFILKKGIGAPRIKPYKSAWSAVYTLGKQPGHDAGSHHDRRVIKCSAQETAKVVLGHMRLAKARTEATAVGDLAERQVLEDAADEIELDLKDAHEGRLPAPVYLPIYQDGGLTGRRMTLAAPTSGAAGEFAEVDVLITPKEEKSACHELNLLNERAVEYLWCWCAHIQLLQMGNLMRPATEGELQEEKEEEAREREEYPTGGHGGAGGGTRKKSAGKESLSPIASSTRASIGSVPSPASGLRPQRARTLGTPRSVLPRRRSGRRSSISMLRHVSSGSDSPRRPPTVHQTQWVVRTTIRHALVDLRAMQINRSSVDDISQKEFTKVWPLLMRAMQAVRLGTVVAANLEQLTKQAQDTRDRQREAAEASDYWKQLAVQSQLFGGGMAAAAPPPAVSRAPSAEAVGGSRADTPQGTHRHRSQTQGTDVPVSEMWPTGGASSSRTAMQRQRSYEPQTPTGDGLASSREQRQRSSAGYVQPQSTSSVAGGFVSARGESGLESPVPQKGSSGAHSFQFGGMDGDEEKNPDHSAAVDEEAAAAPQHEARAPHAPSDCRDSLRRSVSFQSPEDAVSSTGSQGDATPSSLARSDRAQSQPVASAELVVTGSGRLAGRVALVRSKTEGSRTHGGGTARHRSKPAAPGEATRRAVPLSKLVIQSELRKHCGEGPTLQAEIARAVLIAIEQDETPEHHPTIGHASQLVRRLKLAVQWECEDVVQAWLHGVQSLVKKNGSINKSRRMAMEAALAYAALRDNDRIARVFLDESVPVDIASVDFLCLKQLLPDTVHLGKFANGRFMHFHGQLRSGMQKKVLKSEQSCKKTKQELKEVQGKIRECKKKIWKKRRGSQPAHRGGPAARSSTGRSSSSARPTVAASGPVDQFDKRADESSFMASRQSSQEGESQELQQLKEILEQHRTKEATLKSKLVHQQQKQRLPVRLLPGRHWLEDLALRLHPHVSREFPRTALDAALVEARMTSCKLEEALESVRVVWALVNRRFRIARLFWRHCSQPLRVALYAAQLLRRLAEVTSSSQQTLEMEADWYESMAIELFSLAGASRQIGGWENSDWKDAALWLRSTAPASWIISDLVVRYYATPTPDQAGDVGFLGDFSLSQPGLLSMGKLYKPGGGKTMIRLAQQGRCQRFIGHPIVQRVLENLWDRGSWDVTASSTGAVLFIAGSRTSFHSTPCSACFRYAFCGAEVDAPGDKPVSHQGARRYANFQRLSHCLDEEVGIESIVEPREIRTNSGKLTVTREMQQKANRRRQYVDAVGLRPREKQSICGSVASCCAALCFSCGAVRESKAEGGTQQQQERAYLGTSVKTPLGKVSTVSAQQELENRRLRLERARETHQVLEVNRQAMEYRRIGSQGAVRKRFTRHGAGAVLDRAKDSATQCVATSPRAARQPPNGAARTVADIDISLTNDTQRVDDLDESHVGWEYHLVCSPHWKFVAHSLSRLVLTFVHAALVMSQNPMQAQFLEVLFYVWKFSQCAEDVVGMYYQGLKQTAVWDIFGLLDYGATAFALIMRIIASARDDLDLLDYAWDVLSLSFIIASIRLLDVLAVIQYFGPLVITISRILLRDIMLFMVLLIIFLGGFAVAITAIFVVRNDTIRIGDPSENRLEALEDLLWSVFGDWTLPLSNADRGDEVFYLGLGKALLGLHMLLSTIVIVNLLIALMSNSFEQTNKLSDLEFKASRVQHISKYLSASSLPPPLNLLTIGWCCMNRVRGCAVAQCSEADSDTDQSALEKRSTHEQQDALSKMHRSHAGGIYNQPAMLPLSVQESRRARFIRHRAMQRLVDAKALD